MLTAGERRSSSPNPGSITKNKHSHRNWISYWDPVNPAAQAQLFSALETFAKDQTVIVTTHNPVFFSAESTKTFVKLSKVSADDGKSPHTKSYPIDLTDMTARDQMQLIGYENNNAALFYDRVVLVEGDSDYIVFPHIARLALSAESLAKSGVSFVRISGKGSLKRYKMRHRRIEYFRSGRDYESVREALTIR